MIGASVDQETLIRVHQREEHLVVFASCHKVVNVLFLAQDEESVSRRAKCIDERLIKTVVVVIVAMMSRRRRCERQRRRTALE